MNRIEIIINNARRSTNTSQIDSVSMLLCQDYLNRIHSYLEDWLFLVNDENDLFVSDFTFQLVPGQDEYPLPVNIYAKSSIDNLAVSFLNGLSNTYLPLKKVSRKQQGFTFGYFIREDKIVLTPRPTSALNMKLAYVRKLPTVGIRNGNPISGTVVASGIIQDLTYTSKIIGKEGNSISITYNKGVKASLAIQDITYVANNFGTSGNLINIYYIPGAIAGSETVSVSGSYIIVKIQNGVSTATQIHAKVSAFAPAIALVSLSITGTGSNVQSVTSPAFLTGGVDNALAGSEIVNVSGYSIAVTIEDGVSTATQVAAKLASSDLVTVAVSGTGSNAQVVAGPLLLSGGVDILTIGSQSSDQLTGMSDFFSTVSFDGTISSYGNIITSYNFSTGVITFTKGTGRIKAGEYVISGQYASSHSQLPNECEKYLITALERMIQYRQSSADVKIADVFTKEELEIIKEVFADNSYDDAKPPVTEWQEWLP